MTAKLVHLATEEYGFDADACAHCVHERREATAWIATDGEQTPNLSERERERERFE